MPNDKSPLITIGIPTYNRADSFLKEALQSAVEQTYRNLEIIVSDNCSTDSTEVVVKSFSDPRIKYIKHAYNIGAINNFNYCVRKAQGSFFLLLHDDDKIDPDFVEACVATLPKKHEPGVIFTFENKVPLYLCNTLFNTKRLQEMGGFKSKTNYFFDAVAYVTLAAKYGRVDIYDVKASFRRHSSNMGGDVKGIRAWCEDCLYLMDIMCGLMPEDGERLRSKGMPWFCIKNYRLASGIKNPLERIKIFLLIYRTFDYCYSPVHFLYSRHVRPMKNSLLRRARQIFRHPQTS